MFRELFTSKFTLDIQHEQSTGVKLEDCGRSKPHPPVTLPGTLIQNKTNSPEHGDNVFLWNAGIYLQIHDPEDEHQ